MTLLQDWQINDKRYRCLSFELLSYFIFSFETNKQICDMMDMTDNEEEPELDSAIILRVKKPEFEACPDLPKSLKNWVEDGWQQYASTLVKKEKLERFINGRINEDLFVDDDIRVKEYDE